MCIKKRFVTRKEAKRHIKSNPKLGLTDCYYCENCLGYHTTSLEKQRSRNYKRYLLKLKKTVL